MFDGMEKMGGDEAPVIGCAKFNGAALEAPELGIDDGVGFAEFCGEVELNTGQCTAKPPTSDPEAAEAPP